MDSLKKNFNKFKKSDAVFFYSKPGCPYCDKLKVELESYAIPFTEIKIESKDISSMLKEVTGLNTFPMLFFGPNKIGGYSDFISLCMTNQLNEKLNLIGLKSEKESLDF